jgi:hypothetical protein
MGLSLQSSSGASRVRLSCFHSSFDASRDGWINATTGSAAMYHRPQRHKSSIKTSFVLVLCYIQ